MVSVVARPRGCQWGALVSLKRLLDALHMIFELAEALPTFFGKFEAALKLREVTL